MKVKYYLDHQGDFVIENYNYARPFANFFPGIAGKYGIPMWVFYANRGQAISSFGTRDKDHAIVEFFPANKAWQFTSISGFRTFVKIAGRKPIFYEPFHNGPANREYRLINQMNIASEGLKLSETNLSLGLETNVEYFTIPNDSYAALARIVKIRNKSGLKRNIQLLDGLPQIIPFGMNNYLLKELSRTLEAWMTAKTLETGACFYNLTVDPSDRPEVVHIKEGNFYLGFHYEKDIAKVIRPIVDPEQIFGPLTDFSLPYRFLAKAKFRPAKIDFKNSITPCGFSLLEFALNKNEEKTFYSVIGSARNCRLLNSLTKRITGQSYLAQKCLENKQIIAALQQDVITDSSSNKFDLYAKQTYLDNILRGGYPLTFGSKVFYAYSRKHGDLERDYNRFHIQPAYFSQGNGNYRDINQNRRMDVWFNPQIKDDNILTFFNLLQTDGFNPLVIKGVNFSLDDQNGLRNKLSGILKDIALDKLIAFLIKPFTPGDLVHFLEASKIGLPAEECLNRVMPFCSKHEEAEHGEGFWTDHWTYNLDLLENYLAIYPEKLKELVFQKKCFTYFDNAEIVKPRIEKHLLYHGLPRQLHALAVDNHKKELLKKRHTAPHLVRTKFGQGEIYHTTLINKLLCLALNKLSSLDPFGVGIEMEANKPNWYDALNGLPALFGSSSCETFELKRLFSVIAEAMEKTGVKNVSLSIEIHIFLIGLQRIINEYFKSDAADKDYAYWEAAGSLKEAYRQKTSMGLSGEETELDAQEIMKFISGAQEKIAQGLKRAQSKKDGLYYAYFINQVEDYRPVAEHFIKPTKFKQIPLPLFLEAQVHALRVAPDQACARKIYEAVSKSKLYDKGLKMYKVTAPLNEMPQEIGRCRVFAPGWLENESIWLHMEYKYLLELLKSGLDKEFYRDFKSCLVPFQKPSRYGRSILENSSFIVSSAFADKKLHGNGFVARLSGSTAEFLQIWLLMNIGKQPFFLSKDNGLNLKFAPKLAGWLFNRRNKAYSFNFLSKVEIVYHNPKLRDTFGQNHARPLKIIFLDKDNLQVEIDSDVVPSPYAEQVRFRQIRKIDVYLG